MLKLPTILLTLVALLAGSVARAQGRPDAAPLEASPLQFSSLPSYVRIVRDKAAPLTLPDNIFDSIAGKTVFKVNRWDLDPADPFLADLVSRTLPEANRLRLRLAGIDLRGAASPEGPYRWNVTLSQRRAAALRGFLAEHLDSVADPYDVATLTVAEDYPSLLAVMERVGDVDAPRVRAVISECGADDPAAIKQRLRALDGGALWSRLLRVYYPDLRAARVVLFFTPGATELPTVAPDPAAAGLSLLPPPAQAPALIDLPAPSTRCRPHLLSLSTNLLYDAFYMPNYGWAPMVNIGAEYYPAHGRFTFRAAFTFPYYHRWSRQKFFQIRDYHLEVRRYFNPGPLHTGPYLALYANAAKYGIGLDGNKGWQGEGIGGAIKAGYVIPLGSGRWRLDFHVAAGAFMTRYDPYVYRNPITGEVTGDYFYDWVNGPETFHRRDHRLWWFGPTEVGVTLSFDILYKRIASRGVSLRRKEVTPW